MAVGRCKPGHPYWADAGGINHYTSHSAYLRVVERAAL
jgi:hypothetical protein